MTCYRHSIHISVDCQKKFLFAQILSTKCLFSETALQESRHVREALDKEIAEQEERLKELTEAYEKFRKLLEQKDYSRRRRTNTSTTYEMINDYKSSTRYRRREETKRILEFIHGGSEPSLYGAWDFLASNASEEIMTKLMSSYKRGRLIKGIFGKAISEYQKSEEALKQSIALKYQCFLSRRKYNLVCKTQSSFFNAEKEVWLPRNIKFLGVDLRLPKLISSDESVNRFVKSLDIGHVTQIPGISGVSRTVTGLVFMIIDLHLRVPHLARKLVWFNENENHFICQFSDDGAPETSELTMSIGSIVCWNFGDQVRSRDFQYLLHCVSVKQNDYIMSELWKQHTEEMKMLEGNVLTVCGKACTVEFQPGADMSWQSWAANELNQAATYPSPYANVHKGNMATMGGTIGPKEGDTWRPYNMELRTSHIEKVNQFLVSLPQEMSNKNRHAKKLQFMAENGIRQLGPPRIGHFADRLRPEPMHCEINAWQHYIDLLYLEAVNRKKFDTFVSVLGAPLGEGDTETIKERHHQKTSVKSSGIDSAGERARHQHILQQFEESFKQHLEQAGIQQLRQDPGKQGCGLGYLAARVREHFTDESNRYNKLPVRLIGNQAIALARYSYRLVDTLMCDDESEAQKIKRLALGKIGEYLRDAGGLFNRIDTNSAQVAELKEVCEMYFNLIALFFPSSINVTTWTVGYAIPYHANLLFNQYKVGYGLVSLQAKEAKHSGVKEDLTLTNRSNVSSGVGKWWQVMRSNYVRSFYLPEHQPMPSFYTSHYQSRSPPHCNQSNVCKCGRDKDEAELTCEICLFSIEVVTCASNRGLTDSILLALKPVVCKNCNARFADNMILSSHLKACCITEVRNSAIRPATMSVTQLKEALRSRGLTTKGNKEVLVRRLEGEFAGEN